jgi:hypothetical protein
VRGTDIAGAGLALILVSTTASAQTVQQLKSELAAKQAEVAELQRRVRELEVRAPPSQLVSTQPATARAIPGTVAYPVPSDLDAPEDEEDERALERTLVREGALVLAPFTYELAPQLSYAHFDKVQNPYLRQQYSAALSARMGLPWEMQVSVSLPYVHNEFRTGGSDGGLGDVGVIFSKELMRESQYGLNVVANAGWTSPTRNGSTLSPMPFVSGFQGGLTASKRLDPLVVFGSLSYFSASSREIGGREYRNSDVVGGRFGGSLAVSPGTSVTMGLNMSYLTEALPYSMVLPKSDRLMTSADIGVSTIVGPRTLLNVTAQFGVTGNVPDLRLITSLPVRF